jgi:hypothetical protein
MNQVTRSRVGLLLMCVVCGLAVFAASSYQEENTGIDQEAYQAFMAAQVGDLHDLQDFYLAQREGYIAILPPDIEFILRQSGAPEILPFDIKSFPAEFTDALIPVYENSVPVYPLTIAEDFTTRETYFLNADGEEVYALPAVNDYTPYAFLEERYPDLFPTAYDTELTDYLKSLYDPARIEIQVKLIAVEDVEPYLYAQAQIAEAASQTQMYSESEGGFGMMLLFTEDWTNHLWLSINGPPENVWTGMEVVIHLPDGFTNGVEVYCVDIATDQYFLGVGSAWTLGWTNRETAGTNQVVWTDFGATNTDLRYYVAGNADIDSDGDGLADARERYIHHTDPNNSDTDGDEFSDGDEVNTYGTDPLDKYSVPPLSMLSASEKYIVDTNGAPVTLKAVNLGGWLVFENWLMKFLPSEFVFTNYALKVVTNDFDEANMRQMLVQNVDYEVVLVATSAPVKMGDLLTETNTPAPSVGQFSPGDYIGFTNIDFGTGVSNLTLVVAVDNESAGRMIDVYMDNVATGALIAVITVEGTGGWWSPGAQTTEGITNLYGIHDVYFKGHTGSGDICNLVSFRFYRDPNARQLIDTFRNAYLQTNDLDRIKELGYNCVRVPFSYSLIQDESGTNYLAEGWDRLDTLLSECAKRRIWVILDLHSTPGGQNSYEHCGQPDGLRNRLWTNPKCQDKTAHLWNTVAARYSNNTTVAGYDLFNEPNPWWWYGSKAECFSNYIVPLHDRIYKSIRSNDTQHLIFMEDNWHDTTNAAFAWNHPRLQDKGWSNVVFEFHNYEHVLNTTNGTNDWYF